MSRRHDRPLLPILCLVLGLAAGARADTPAPPREKIEQIVITGSRHPLPIAQIGTSLTVIDSEAIQLEQQRDAIELLRDVPGLQLSRSGSRGGASGVFVRGGETDHNLILIDGVQVNRGGGSFDLSNLSTDGIERVEVLRGPASALYGSDALASVVQLITKRGEGPMQGSLRAAYGSDSTYEIGTSLSGGSERFGYTLSAGRYATDGLNGLNNDADNSTVRTRLDYRPAETVDAKLTLAYSAGAFDFPTDFDFETGGFPPIDPDQGRRTHELASGLEIGWRASDRLEHRVALGWSDSEDLFFDGNDSARGNLSDFDDAKTDQDEDRLSAEYRLLWSALKSESLSTFVTAGYEYERERFDSRSRSIFESFDFVTGESLGLERDALRIHEHRQTSALFLQTDWTLLENTFATLGGRLDDNSKYGTVFTPIVTLAHLFPEAGTRVHAAFSKGIKEPRFDENFDSSFAKGNPKLRPEKSRSGELGVEQAFLGGVVQTSLTLFRTDYDRLISFVSTPFDPSSPRFFGTFRNVQDVRSQGIETELRVAPSERVRLSASYTRLRTRVRDAGAGGSPAFREGKELLRRPTHSGAVSLGYRGERFEGRVRAALLGPREDLGNSSVRVRTDARVTVDVAGSYLVYTSSRGTQTRLTLRADNLLDEEDDEVFGFESPGFQVLAGVELRF